MSPKICPRAYADAPHEMRQDADGRWYCPIELDAKREQEWRARQESAA